jgi:hypothetical protein
MRLALGLILLGACLILFVVVTFVFQELSNDDRKRYYQLKARLKQHTEIETKLQQEIENFTLSNYDEWIKMRY